MKRRVLHGQRGVEVVELAITLPLTLFLIIGTLDVSRVVTGYSSVRAAIITGTRQAVGRERDEFAAVETAMSAMVGTSNVATPDLAAFTTNIALVSPQIASQFTTQNLPYLYSCPEGSAANPLAEIYRYEVRALINANYILSSSFPNAVYPCPPGDPRECFTCCVLRGATEGFRDLFSVVSASGSRLWTPNFIGTRCEVQIPLTSGALTIGMMSPFIKISASSYSAVSNYNGGDYIAQ